MSPTIDPIQDITALANYAPRKAAIEMILDGRIDDYIAWARGDGSVAAFGRPTGNRFGLVNEIPLDAALERRIGQSLPETLDYDERYKREAQLLKQAFGAIDHFLCSPLEIALRAGKPEVFEKLLVRLTSPREKFLQARWISAGGWTSLGDRSKAADISHRFDDVELWLGTQVGNINSQKPLLLLALLLGKPEAAAAMQRCGWGPSDPHIYYDLLDPLRDALPSIERASPEALRAFADDFGIRPDTFQQTLHWLNERFRLSNQLEDLLNDRDNDQGYAGIRDKISELVEAGALVTGHVLAMATDANDLDMLRRLFAAGGNPNAVQGNGFDYLASVNADKLTPEALQIWLDHGAAAINKTFTRSTLEEWAWKGRLGLIRQAVDRAAGPVALTYQQEVEVNNVKSIKTFSPVLYTAVLRGHVELAAWLIRDKGLSLDDWDSWEDGEWKPCRSFAPPGFLKQLRSALAKGGGKA